MNIHRLRHIAGAFLSDHVATILLTSGQSIQHVVDLSPPDQEDIDNADDYTFTATDRSGVLHLIDPKHVAAVTLAKLSIPFKLTKRRSTDFV